MKLWAWYTQQGVYWRKGPRAKKTSSSLLGNVLFISQGLLVYNYVNTYLCWCSKLVHLPPPQNKKEAHSSFTRNRTKFILEPNLSVYGMRTQTQVIPRLMASIAVITHRDQKHLGEERVNFTLQLTALHGGSQGTNSGQEPRGRGWSRSHEGRLLSGLLSMIAQPASFHSPGPPVRDGTAHSHQLINWANIPWACLWTSLMGVFSIEAPSSSGQMDTNTNKHSDFFFSSVGLYHQHIEIIKTLFWKNSSHS